MLPIIFSLLSFSSFAQKLILSFNAGINGSLYKQSLGFGGYGLIRFYTPPQFERMEFAVGVDAGYISNNVTIKHLNLNGEEEIRKIKSYIANPYFLPHIVVNYRTPNRSYFYTGLTGGYMLSYVQVLSSGYNSKNQFVVNRVGNKLSNGISIGAQTGYVLNIKKNFALNTELGVRWASLGSGTNFMYFPVSFGARLKLYNDREYDKPKKKKRYR